MNKNLVLCVLLIISNSYYLNSQKPISQRFYDFKMYAYETAFDRVLKPIDNTDFTSITEDSFGIKWAAGLNGLTRIGRESYFTYNYKNGIINNSVENVYIDKKGVIWISSKNSPPLFLNQNKFNLYYNQSNIDFSKFTITSFFENTKNELFITTTKGIYQLLNGKVIPFFLGKQIFEKAVYAGIEINGLYYFSTEEGVFKTDKKSYFKLVLIDKILYPKFGNFIKNPYNKQGFFIGRNKIWEFNGAIWKSINTKDNAIDQAFRGISIDKDSCLWFGKKSLYRYEINKNKLDSLNEIGLHNELKTQFCFLDKQSNIWISNGVQAITALKEINIDFKRFSKINNRYNTSVIDEKGDINYVDRKTLNILEFSLSTHKIKNKFSDKINKSLSKTEIISFKNLKNGNTLIISSINNNDKVLLIKENGITSFKSEENLYASCTFEDTITNTILIGTKNKILQIKEDTLINFLSLGTENETINSINRDCYNNLWIATSRSCYLYSKNKLVNVFNSFGLPKIGLSLIIPYKNYIVVGTYGIGIILIKINNESNYSLHNIINTDNGITSNTIYKIDIDKFGNSLVTAGYSAPVYIKDLFNLSRRKFLKINNEFINILKLNDFNVLNLNKKSGRVTIVTDTSLIQFDSSILSNNSNSSKVLIKNIQLNKSDVDWSKKEIKTSSLNLPIELKLNHNENYITFYFEELSNEINNTNGYFYRLLNSEKKWNKTTYTDITFNNLKPGLYTLQIKSNENPNAEITNYKFEIMPPWWNTIAFKIILTIIILFSAFLIYRNRIKQLTKQNIELEEKVKIRTNQLNENIIELDKLISDLEKSEFKQIQINKKNNLLINLIAHDIKSPLNFLVRISKSLYESTSIENSKIKQILIDDIRIKSFQIHQHLNLINLETSNILNLSRMDDNIKYELNKINLNDFIESNVQQYEAIAKEKKITITKNVSNVFINLNQFALNCILRNLLDNSIKYTDFGMIEIKAYANFENKILEIKISDSGNGIAKSKLLLIQKIESNESFSEMQSLGYTIIYKMLKIINGKIDIKSEETKGTNIELFIPFEV